MILGLFIQAFIFLLAIYYVTVVIHIGGWSKLTYKKFSTGKAIIPFYYWIFN